MSWQSYVDFLQESGNTKVQQSHLIGDDGTLWAASAEAVTPNAAEVQNISGFLNEVAGNSLQSDGLSIDGNKFVCNRRLPGDNYFIATGKKEELCANFHGQYLIAYRIKGAVFIAIGTKDIKAPDVLRAVELTTEKLAGTGFLYEE